MSPTLHRDSTLCSYDNASARLVQMYYLRARYYRPTVGRFLTADSYEGTAKAPASLQRYIYGGADPADRRDPSGQASLIAQALLIGEVVFQITAPAVLDFALEAGGSAVIYIDTIGIPYAVGVAAHVCLAWALLSVAGNTGGLDPNTITANNLFCAGVGWITLYKPWGN